MKHTLLKIIYKSFNINKIIMNKYDWISNKKNKSSSSSNNDEILNTEDQSSNTANTISSFSNHIYFNDDINNNTAFKLNNALRLMEAKLKTLNIDNIPIYLHLTTNGGIIHSAFSIIDCMNSISLPIYTVIEGFVASAGTLISVSGEKRYISKNAYVLIHELRSGIWGKMSELEEEMTNIKKIQEHLTNIYLEKTSIKKKKLNRILKKDVEWNAEEALEFGIADEIYLKN
jgi:ATP-dependent Clp endopeptidase proteolytic subunit ClpP